LIAVALAALSLAVGPVHAPAKVTYAWSGRTVWLAPGQSFLLGLGGPPPDWRVRVADQRVLARRVNVTVVRGAQGIYVAKAPGKTTVTATDHYACQDVMPPCLPPNRLFRLTVIVRR
jgi:hypothetical protein